MEIPDDQAELIVRVLSGEANETDKKLHDKWLQSSLENRRYFEQISHLWEESSKQSEIDDHRLKSDWRNVQTRIVQIQNTERKPSRTRFLYIVTRVAATLLLFSGCIYLIQKFYTNDLVVSTQATLTSVTLPDGSEVTLNANSRLTYPKQFNADTRTVELEGEAFFDVSRDIKRPFIIATRNTRTEVLGTSFAVKSLEDSVVVTVVTGRVSFQHVPQMNIVLAPGERGFYANGLVQRSANNDQNFLSWKTNRLDFNGATLDRFSYDVGRHFRVPIKVSPTLGRTCTITAQFENENLQQVLDELKLLFSVTLEMHGDTVVINGNGCNVN